jgi:hypothetical protein
MSDDLKRINALKHLASLTYVFSDVLKDRVQRENPQIKITMSTLDAGFANASSEDKSIFIDQGGASFMFKYHIHRSMMANVIRVTKIVMTYHTSSDSGTNLQHVTHNLDYTTAMYAFNASQSLHSAYNRLK